MIKNYLKYHVETYIDEWDEKKEESYKLTEARKKDLQKDLNDLKNNKIVSDKEANRQVDKWLKSNFFPNSHVK